MMAVDRLMKEYHGGLLHRWFNRAVTQSGFNASWVSGRSFASMGRTCVSNPIHVVER
jgi:hypothetical protein